jgi:hypothetical protein
MEERAAIFPQLIHEFKSLCQMHFTIADITAD